MFNWLRNRNKSRLVSLPPAWWKPCRTEEEEKVDWGLSLVGIPDWWKDTKGKGVRVGVLDTGANFEHPDLKGAIIKARDFTGGNDPTDRQGHGSFVSSIIAARQDGRGMVGIAPECCLVVGKVLSDSGTGDWMWLIDGIKWMVEEKVDVINMSLGGPQAPREVLKELQKAVAQKILVIAAAGNEGLGKETLGYPAAWKEVLAVGSINRKGDRSRYSSCGKNLSIMAPGEDVLGADSRAGYMRASGTSFSSPFVAGIAALYVGADKTDPEAFRKELEERALDMDDPGWDHRTGWGLVRIPRKGK